MNRLGERGCARGFAKADWTVRSNRQPGGPSTAVGYLQVRTLNTAQEFMGDFLRTRQNWKSQRLVARLTDRRPGLASFASAQDSVTVEKGRRTVYQASSEGGRRPQTTAICSVVV